MKSVPRGNRASGGWRLIHIAAVFGVAMSVAVTACGSGDTAEPGANNTVKTGELPTTTQPSIRTSSPRRRTKAGT
jgi:iron(III) transport system substrate-binding protein